MRLSSIITTGLLAGSCFIAAFPVAAEEAAASPEAASIVWARQLRTAGYDSVSHLGVDGSGNIVVHGTTSGALAGSNHGNDDVFLAKYNTSGTLQWKIQRGSPQYDTAGPIAVNAAGDIVVHQVIGGANKLVKYNSSGAIIWERSLSNTIAGIFFIASNDVLAVGSNVYRYTSAGNLISKKALAAPNCTVDHAAIDKSGSIFIGGSSRLNACVVKYNSNLGLLWRRYFNRGDPFEWNYVADLETNQNGEVLVAGATNITDISGDILYEGFLLKYLGNGTLGWKRNIRDNSPSASVINAVGDLFTAGYPRLESFNPVESDAVVARYRGIDGARAWLQQFGAPRGSDHPNDIAMDRQGNLYVGGYTYGALAAPNLGNSDAFVVKLRP